MAGIATHLVIAREIVKLLPCDTFKEEGLFYEGSIAPDAIHAREGFVRSDKKHTHLRDNIRDRDFPLRSNQELFHKRVAKFIEDGINKDDGLLDLYRGYVVHILTDELYLLTIRQEFIKIMDTLGIDQSDKEFYHSIITDMIRNDFLLAERYEDMPKIYKQLVKVESYEIEGLLSEIELRNSRKWVIDQYFTGKYDIKEPVYISYERTLEFVDNAANNIVKRLSKGGSLPTMF